MEEKDKVTGHLKQLHRELEQTDTLKHDDRQLLLQIVADINALLDRTENAAGYESTVRRLETAVERFEVTHPELTAVIARVINGLTNLGI